MRERHPEIEVLAESRLCNTFGALDVSEHSKTLIPGSKWEALPSTTQTLGVNIQESVSPEIHALRTQEYSNFNVVLDSGAADHVVGISGTPGYEIKESAGSKAGSCFVAANGERIPNRVEVCLDMKHGHVPAKSTFQISKISKPLWSVGKLCDAGCKVEFGKAAAVVTHAFSGKKVAEFQRNP